MTRSEPCRRTCPVLIGTRENHAPCGLPAHHVREQDGPVFVCVHHNHYGKRLPLHPDELPFYANRRLVVRRS